MIPEFNLPSRPDIAIQMRDALVEEAMEWSSANPALDEEITTLFLNTVCQDGGLDAKHWTAPDRVTALMWFHVHVAQETHVSTSYDCPYCKQKHSIKYDLRDLLDDYVPLNSNSFTTKEKFGGKEIQIHHLLGMGLEHLEAMKMELAEIEDGTSDYRQALVDISLTETALRFDFIQDMRSGVDEGKALENRLAWLKSLPTTDFTKLKDLIRNSIDLKRHGLPVVVSNGKLEFLGPTHKCPHPDFKEVAAVRLRFPFLGASYIPKL